MTEIRMSKDEWPKENRSASAAPTWAPRHAPDHVADRERKGGEHRDAYSEDEQRQDDHVVSTSCPASRQARESRKFTSWRESYSRPW